MMANTNMFDLVKIIKAANGDPSAMTDAVWSNSAYAVSVARVLIEAGFSREAANE